MAARRFFDTVVLGATTYDADGLQYADGGARENGVLVEGRTHRRRLLERELAVEPRGGAATARSREPGSRSSASAANIVYDVKQQLRPLFDQVVIKELDPDRVRRSGLVLPPGEHESPPQHGIVLAVGPGLDWWGGVGIKMPVAAGDHVVFAASAGVWVDIEEERLLVCRVGQLLGVLEELSDPPEALGRGGSVAGSAE